MELDFTRQTDYLWALLPEVVLSVWGMVVLLVGVARDRKGSGEGVESNTTIGWLALAGVMVAALANGWLHGVGEAGPEAVVAVDGLARFANWAFLVSAALSILVSLGYVERQRLQATEFYALVLFATVGMMVMAAARDLVLVFLGLEVMSIVVYALTAFNRRDRRAAEAGLKYFLLGAFSTGFFLLGIALVWGASGSMHLHEIAAAVQEGVELQAFLWLGIGLLTVGFAFKVSAVPFHMWTPDVYEGAPTPVTAFMSTAVKAAAFVAFLRVFAVAFGGLEEVWHDLLWWIAAITMIVANLIALVQTNVKRMLAYSSIAHAGYLLIALVAANETAHAGLLFYLLVYTVMNVGAFAGVIGVSEQGEENLLLQDYAGFGWRDPLFGVLFTIFLLSLAGFPGTAGFIAKAYLLFGAADSGLWTLAVILVLTTVVSYAYYLRVAWYMWMREAPEAETGDRVEAPMALRIALTAAAGVVILLGILPGGVLAFARESVTSLLAG